MTTTSEDMTPNADIQVLRTPRQITFLKEHDLQGEAITHPDHHIIKQHTPKPYQWQADVDIHALRKPSVPRQHTILTEHQMQGEATTPHQRHNRKP